MDTGERNKDYRFYIGFEGEKEIVITLPNVEYHIWDGYFEDIFGNPMSLDSGWLGFTRDYNECKNEFDDECIECAILPEEYLIDLHLYDNQAFTYPETGELLELLINIMQEAERLQTSLLVRVN